MTAEQRHQISRLPPTTTKLKAAKHFAPYHSNLVRTPSDIDATENFEEYLRELGDLPVGKAAERTRPTMPGAEFRSRSLTEAYPAVRVADRPRSGGRTMTRDKATVLVQRITDADYVDDREASQWLDTSGRALGCTAGYLSDLIIWPPGGDPTAAEIVDQALTYQPIAL